MGKIFIVLKKDSNYSFMLENMVNMCLCTYLTFFTKYGIHYEIKGSKILILNIHDLFIICSNNMF